MKTIEIGRETTNHVVLDKSSVSRKHCTLILDDDGRYILEDHSKNGTYVNGRLIKNKRVPLRFDSVVVVEGYKLTWLKYFNSVSESMPPSSSETVQEPPTPQPSVSKPEPPVQTPPPTEPPHAPKDIYDMTSDYVAEYDSLKQNLLIPLDSYRLKLCTQKTVTYHTFSDDLLIHAVESYEKSFADLTDQLNRAATDSLAIQHKFEHDLLLLDNLRIYKSIFDISHNQTATADLYAIEKRRSAIQQQMATLKSEVRNHVEDIALEFKTKHGLLFPDQYETASVDNRLWNTITCKKEIPFSMVQMGVRDVTFALFDSSFVIKKTEYLHFLNGQHIAIRYNRKTRQNCFDYVNTLLGRLLAASRPGNVSVTMIDAESLEGTCSEFKRLDHKVFNVFSREEDITALLEETYGHIEHILQNVLHDDEHTLADYNRKHEQAEGYRLLVMESFPSGINGRSAELLKKILKNGVRAGVQVLLLVDEDSLVDGKLLTQFLPAEGGYTYDFTCKLSVSFDGISSECLAEIVRYTNKGIETKKNEVVVKFTDYLLPEEEWWTRETADDIEIPFGVSPDLQVQGLQITQKSGQNSAIVIGIPGSGKSVFLHSLIVSAALRYSPEELGLYLIDFSGVEFNTYALHKLPHAKVIAPEAEREFGLSVLRELKEEGFRRMNLCRDNGVSNIVELRRKNPGLQLPRLLVIIDEFQKLFELSNDKISQESQSIIEIIIREYRKFGINIVLATQTLRGNPIDMQMMANRVVFEYAPSDAGHLFEGQYPAIYRVGECIYNAKSGVATANVRVQTFLLAQKERDELLEAIYEKAQRQHMQPNETVVFRSDELHDFRLRRMNPRHVPQQQNPVEIGLYLGEPIAIAEYDVSASLNMLSGDNILVIGGEPKVAQQIALCSSLSMMDAHADESAEFHFFNFMLPTDPLADLPQDYFAAANFEVSFPCTGEEVSTCLGQVIEEINRRRMGESDMQKNIYLSFYAFQRAQMFKKAGDYRLSEAAQQLNYILENGPLVNVYTMLQVDKLENMQRSLDNILSCFNHRVALQMEEASSQKIIGSYAANKLFEMNRKNSEYRAYYYNNDQNVLCKFKPYKLL